VGAGRIGYAHAVTYPPDVKHADRFIEAEKKARYEGRGLCNEN
jgi:endonuclease YncB( thermonuclease family)